MSTTTLMVTIGAGLLAAAVAAFLIWRVLRSRADRVAAPPREDYSAGDPMAWDTHHRDGVGRSSPIIPGPAARPTPRPIPRLGNTPTRRRTYSDDVEAYDPTRDPANPASPLWPGHYSAPVDTTPAADDTGRSHDGGSSSSTWGGYSGGGYSSGHSSSDSGSSSGSSYSGGSDSGGSSSGSDSGGGYSG